MSAVYATNCRSEPGWHMNEIPRSNEEPQIENSEWMVEIGRQKRNLVARR
jgi:hypothetical protein